MSEDYEYYDTQNASRGDGIPRVFVGSPYQRGHGIGSFLGGLFRKVLPFLSKGVRAVGKEALRAGINVIEDIENNTPFKEAVKSRFKESSGNLKRKAKEKITSLMTGTGYKVPAKTAALQFPFFRRESRIAVRKRRHRQTSKKKSSKNTSARRKITNKKTTKKKKIRAVGRKTNKKSSITTSRRRIKKRSVSDIFS